MQVRAALFNQTANNKTKYAIESDIKWRIVLEQINTFDPVWLLHNLKVPTNKKQREGMYNNLRANYYLVRMQADSSGLHPIDKSARLVNDKIGTVSTARVHEFLGHTGDLQTT